MELHVFPIPIPPPTSLSTRFLWVFPVHQARELVSCIQPGLVICFTIDNIQAVLSKHPPSPSRSILLLIHLALKDVLFFYNFIYFWMRWVFTDAGKFLQLQDTSFSLWRLLLLQSMGTSARRLSSCGSWAPGHRLNSCGTQA